MSFHNRKCDRRREFKNKRKPLLNNRERDRFHFFNESTSSSSKSNEQPNNSEGDRFHYYGESSSRSNSEQSEEPSSSKNRKHPRGLKGKEIGLFYAKQNKKAENAPKRIKISDKIQTEINTLLKDVVEFPANITNNYEHINESPFKRIFLQSITTTFDEKLNNTEVKGHLEREDVLDQLLKIELLTKTVSEDASYREILNFRKKLPSHKCKDDILELLANNQVILVSGETGCGKTTQIPQYILDDHIMKGNGSLCKVVCTQPTRISAISVAERVAVEMQEKIGDGGVGYSIRLEKRQPRNKGSILFCTTGVLLQQLQHNSALEGISHLIMDEVHERDIQCDILLTLIKKVIVKRPDLKLILMSATLNAERFSKYFNNCPAINIPGFTYPVTEYFLEDALELTNFEFEEPVRKIKKWFKHSKKKMREAMDEDNVFTSFIEPYVRNLEHEHAYSLKTLNNLRNPNSEILNIPFIFEVIKYIVLQQPIGAILVFLPGISDITALHKLLQENKILSPLDVVIPLHSQLATVNQKLIFERPLPGVRKIILATNIAETSITIDDVIYVIDCGKMKLKRYDIKHDIETLKSEWVSLANANQRRGRAGRVQAGHCYHLYSKARHMALDAYQLPEILRTRLDEVILQLKSLQVGLVTPFFATVMDVPNPRSIQLSLNLLQRLNALNDSEELTPLGYHLANFPMDPRSGKMILLGTMFSCLDPILSIAASLAYKNAFELPYDKEKQFMSRKTELSKESRSDHLVLAEAFKGWEGCGTNKESRKYCYDYFLNHRTLVLLKDMKKQFAEMLHDMKFLPSSNPKDSKFNMNSNNESLLKAIICAALYPNVARIRNCKITRGRPNVSVVTLEDGPVHLFPSSINAFQLTFPSPFLVYHLKLKSTQIFLHDTTMAHPFPLLFFCDKIQLSCAEEERILKISQLMRFKCNENEADIIYNLRNKFNSLLKYKVAHPGFIDWSQSKNSDVLILRAIMQLVTLEDNGSLDDD